MGRGENRPGRRQIAWNPWGYGEGTTPVFAGPVLLYFGPLRTLTVNAAGFGAVVRNPSAASYARRRRRHRDALDPGLAGTGLRRVERGDASGTQHPLPVVLAADKTIVATFAPIPRKTIGTNRPAPGRFLRVKITAAP